MNLLNKIAYQHMLLAAGGNPMEKINSIVSEFQGYLLGAIAGITALVIVKDAIKYQQGTADEKAQSVKDIKKAIYMGGGVFVFIWIATTVIDKLK